MISHIKLNDEDKWLLDALAWRITPRGYIEATMRDNGWRKTVKFHHFIIGTPIPPLVTDHINRDPLDNRRCNIRIVTKTVNNRNIARRGVVIETAHGRYQAKLYQQHIGNFATEDEAYEAVDRRIAEIGDGG